MMQCPFEFEFEMSHVNDISTCLRSTNLRERADAADLLGAHNALLA